MKISRRHSIFAILVMACMNCSCSKGVSPSDIKVTSDGPPLSPQDRMFDVQHERELLEFENWLFVLDSIKLSPTCVISYDARLLYRGQVPVMLMEETLQSLANWHLRIWDLSDLEQCYILRGCPTVASQDAGRTIQPGETLNIHWTKSIATRYDTDLFSPPNNGFEFYRSEDVRGDGPNGTPAVSLIPGKEYLVDGFLYLSGYTVHGERTWMNENIASSNKLLVVVPGGKTSAQTQPADNH